MDAELRAPRPDEAEAIALLLNAHSQRLWGADAVTVAVVEHWFEKPGFDIEQDVRVAVAPDGSLVGYGDLDEGGERTRYWLDMCLLPEAGVEVGDRLAGALEARARERAVPDALARGVFAERDDLARRIYEARGYELVRHSLQMERSLADEPEPPAWPRGLELRTATPDDLERIWRAAEDGFADHWEFHPTPFEEFAHWANGPDSDLSLWFLAMDGDEIAGACLCADRDRGDRDAGYVASLSVRPRWRRRGLALALLLHSFRELRSRGRARATLGVDAENTTGAVRLYERAGMRIARRYDFVDKPL